MLKFLTHKLRTHSLNEDPNHEKADDDHDSGTESDDEFQDGTRIADEPSTPIEIPESPGPTDSAVPSDTDFGAPPPPPFGFTSCARHLVEDLDEDLEVEARSEQRKQVQQVAQSREPEVVRHHHHQHHHHHHHQGPLSYGNDQHSSEEELEVINSPKVVPSQGCRPATAPEKRKWSEVSSGGPQAHCSRQTQAQQQQQQERQQQQQQTNLGGDAGATAASCSAPVSRAGREPAGSGSSDEEVQGLLGGRSGSGSVISQPVQFRTSPPVDAHKPGRSLSPPPKLFHASSRDLRPLPRPRSRPRPHPHLHTHLDHHHHHHHLHHHHHHQQQQQHHHHHHHPAETDVDSLSACSPRKRHRPPHRQPRPCLDFEKMQQLKARAVTAWRHSGEHGNELSVFCW